MADFKLRAPPRLRFYGAVTVDGVIGTGGSVALAGNAVARAQGVAALLRGINFSGAAIAGSQAAAALFKAANLSSVAIAGAYGSGDLGGPDADWNARSTAAGVVLANRLQTQGDLDAWRSPDAPSTANCSLDTAVKVPGAVASFKVAVLNTDGANSGAYRIFFGSLAEFGDGDTVWFSFRVRAPAQLTYQPWPGVASTDGNKLAILSRWTASNQINEIVFQSMRSVGMVAGYHQNGTGFAGIEQNFTSAAGADYRWQTDVDLGANPLTGTNPDTGAAWTAYEQQRRQYGMLYQASSASNWRIGYGDPLAQIFRHYPDEWITITSRLVIGNFGSANNRWTAWAARQGQPYQKLWDRQNIQLGAGPNYDALWLLPYATNRTSGGKKVSTRGNTFTGAEILTVGLGTPIGAGTLEYNATTQRFRWAGNGEAFGTARGFSTANDILTLNVTSGTATDSYLVVKVTPALLPPTGVVTDTITIADGRPDTQINYNDVIISTAAINAPGGYPPLDSTSTLARIAAAMPARSWVYLDGTTQNGVVCTTPTCKISGSTVTMAQFFGQSGGNTGGNLPYANKGAWNPIHKRIEIVGRDHGNASGNYSYYDETGSDAHTWQRYLSALLDGSFTHNFDCQTVNPYTGEVYFHPYNSANIRKWASGTSLTGFTVVTNVPNHANIIEPIEWWTGSQVGLGSQGLLLGMAFVGNVYVSAYDPVLNSWVWTRQLPSISTANYNGFIAYSSVKNVAVMGVGNNDRTGIWKLDSTATVTKYAAAAPISIGVAAGQVVADPVTGNFIVHSDNGFYEFNPDGAGTWTALATQPSTVNKNVTSGGGGAPGVCLIPLPEHGVIAFVSTSSGVGRMHLYRHG